MLGHHNSLRRSIDIQKRLMYKRNRCQIVKNISIIFFINQRIELMNIILLISIAIIFIGIIKCFKSILWSIFVIIIGILIDIALNMSGSFLTVEFLYIGRTLWIWGILGLIISIFRRLKVISPKPIKNILLRILVLTGTIITFIILFLVITDISYNTIISPRIVYDSAKLLTNGTQSTTYLSNNDTRIILLWGYVLIKFNRYGNIIHYDDPYDSSVWNNAIEICDIAEHLPTSKKYKDLSDAILNLTRNARPCFEKHQWPYLPSEGLSVSEAIANHLGDFNFVDQHISQEEKNHILDEFFFGH